LLGWTLTTSFGNQIVLVRMILTVEIFQSPNFSIIKLGDNFFAIANFGHQNGQPKNISFQIGQLKICIFCLKHFNHCMNSFWALPKKI
jgi:hypothetical protein